MVMHTISGAELLIEDLFKKLDELSDLQPVIGCCSLDGLKIFLHPLFELIKSTEIHLTNVGYVAITCYWKLSKWISPKVILALFERIYCLLQAEVLDNNSVLFFYRVRKNKISFNLLDF